ncbi:MAG: permease-like cell division protein FtsX [Fimbriimonadales bacterium]|nr:permease-like cell division protein FtsX [Fimbriimonadales bacterium]
MLDHLVFLIGEAFVALRRNRMLSFAAVSTVAVSLYLLGGLGYVYLRVSAFAERIPGQFDMRVFLKEGVTFDQIRSTARRIRSVDGVADARHIPREIAWRKMREQMPKETEGLENPLPDAFKVTLSDLGKADSVRAAIQRIETVEPNGIVYDEAARQYLDQGLRFLRWLGGTLGGLLLVTAGVLIYNAIQLTVVARARELRIMRLVGATGFTVGTPFVIEGALQGLFGGALANVLVWMSHTHLQQRLASLQATADLGPYPVAMGFAAFCGAGAIYGAVCSLLSLRRAMRQTT